MLYLGKSGRGQMNSLGKTVAEGEWGEVGRNYGVNDMAEIGEMHGEWGV